MIKRAYVVQMTYDVSDDEKQEAEKALLYFTHAAKLLDVASDHLDIMKVPFKDNPEIDPKEVVKTRAAIRRFRDKSIDNFNDFKKAAFKCVQVMQPFSSDTQTLKLVKSFISSVDELEDDFNDMVELFDTLDSKTFAQDIVASMEKIQKLCDDIYEIIDNRLKHHIQTNIIAKSWVDNVGNDLQMEIMEQTPLIIDLYNERQEALSNIVKEKNNNINVEKT